MTLLGFAYYFAEAPSAPSSADGRDPRLSAGVLPGAGPFPSALAGGTETSLGWR